MILSTHIKKWGHIDAIRKEALLFYKCLCREIPEADVILVSIEDETDNPINVDDFIVTNLERLSKLIEQVKPDIIHIIESTPYLFYQMLEGITMIPAKVVITCVDNNPLYGLTEQMIEEIMHLSDHNDCFLYCYSENALHVLHKAGIRNAAITEPLIELVNKGNSDSETSPQKISLDKAVVGFASTPFNQSSFSARGIYLLEKVLKHNDVKVKIPWRENAVKPPKIFVSNEKVDLSYGFINMDEFYKAIDIYLIPFAEYGQNHASPHSFWEAIMYGKPLVVTNKVGIASLVDEYDIGVVSETTESGLIQAINRIINNYNYYCERVKFFRDQINKSILNPSNILKRYIETYEILLNNPGNTITLSGWRTALRLNNQELVKGSIALKNYYSQQYEAINYRERRFGNFPMNIYNLMELQALRLLIEKHSLTFTEPLELLDIASGDGRVAEVLYAYGNTTIIENSENMLRIIIDNMHLNKKHNLITLINGDFLNLDMDIYNSHFHMVTAFRFIRHFEYIQRRDIYSKIRTLLKPQGFLIFDVPNRYTEILLRNKLGWDKFNIYDVFWTKESISAELELSGFELKNLINVGQYCFRDFLSFDFNLPISWIAIAVKK